MAALGISLRPSVNCGLGDDAELDLRAHGPESLAYRLERALADTESEFSIDADGHVLLLSTEEAFEAPPMVIYDVTAISRGLDGAGALIILIQEGVEASAWDNEDVSIRAYLHEGRRMLSVAVSYRVQRKVRRYLNDLAAMGTSARGVASTEPSTVNLSETSTSGSSPVIVPTFEMPARSMDGGVF
jgi:hypothetical protein